MPLDVGRQISDIRLNIKVPDLEQMIHSVLDDLRPAEREVEDEEGRWHSLQVHPYKTLENKIDGVVLVLMDIDIAKKANEQLKQSGAVLRDVMDTIREPLLVLDSDFRVVDTNHSYIKAFDLSAEKVIGVSLYSLSSGVWNTSELRTALEELLRSKGEINDFLVESNLPNVGRRTMLLNARMLLEFHDRSPMILLAIEDISERKRAEAALIKSEKLAVAVRMAASLAHEINNPLQAMSNLLLLLTASTELTEKNRQHILETEKLLSRVTYLTRQSLSFYRDSDKPQEVDIREVLDGVSELYAGLIRTKHITLTKSTCSMAPY